MLEEPLKVVRRWEWGAKRCVAGLLPVIPPLQYIVVHYYTSRRGCYCPATCREYMKRLQRRAVKERKLGDIPFNFLIAPSEEIYEGRGWDVSSDKSLPYKEKWGNKYDISFIGNYLVKTPKLAVLRVLEKVIQIGIKKGYLREDYEILQVRDRPIKTHKFFSPVTDQENGSIVINASVTSETVTTETVISNPEMIEPGMVDPGMSDLGMGNLEIREPEISNYDINEDEIGVSEICGEDIAVSDLGD